ncbi:MAG: S41 family peptidase [Flavobacteriaceae bacterium]|nr:S41 family peptidase [Flavobacteriaceae bacterium]
MTKYIKSILPLLIAIAVVIGIFIGSNLNYQNKTAMLFGNSPQEAKIKRLIDFIQYDYIDKVNTDSLLDGTIKNIIAKLDPHSVYIPVKEHTEIIEKMEGKFVGVGIQFRMFKDTLTVIKTTKNGPSEKAGLKAGDRILIADKDTLFGRNLNNNDIIKKLKGQPKSKVYLTIYRKSNKNFIPLTVTRGSIPINSIDVAYMLNFDIGYIKLNSFTATSYTEFKTALNDLKRKGMRKMVLDLRGNSGGYISIATAIIDEFLEDNKLIVFTKDKKGRIENSLATKKGGFEDGKIYVLIDENSASASEILAGALQDNDKGVIVGRRSFGKGLVQQDMKLGDGSSVRLTTARYYTPTGRSIQKPYKLNQKRKYYNDDFEKRFKSGELTSADSIKVVDSLKFITPKGKLVYGGGGITPDIFVAIDTTILFKNFHFRSMNEFAFNYIDNHRNEFENMPLSYFIDDFDSNQKIFNLFIKKVYKNKAIKHNSQTEHYLKAIFARELYDENGFYQVLNLRDKMILKVLELENDIKINKFEN